MATARKAKTPKKTAAKQSAKKQSRRVAPKWVDLSRDEKITAAKNMLAIYLKHMRFAAGKYNVVSSSKHRALRERPQVETGGEDDALTYSLRLQFFNMARNGVRNNETLNGILTQFRVNCVGIEGGKAQFNFGDEYKDAAEQMQTAFANWCEECEFSKGENLNDVLKLILQTVIICGDVGLVFDDGHIEGSGRILGFEPDSIANMPSKEFRKRFPDYEQRQGRIVTKNGRFCGFIASSSQRGREEFDDADHVLVFTKKPDESYRDCYWTLVGRAWRFNQGRATSPVAAPLAALMDVNALLGYEVESAKKNSQTYAQLIQTHPDDEDVEDGDPAENADLLDEDVSDSDLEAAMADVKDSVDTDPITFDELDAAGALYDVMPANSKLELLDTKHPNPNMPEFIRLVACRGGWALGLCTCFTMGRVETSYTGFRGEQLMTWPVFQEMQKFLERKVCAWIIPNWYRWAVRHGDVPGNLKLPDNWMRRISWHWPMMKEVNAVDAQRAWNAGLKNGTIGYADILGPDWRDKIAARAEEKKYLESLGMTHPSSETISGQIIGANGTVDNKPQGDNTDEKDV